jgi:hypothetical protein
MASRDCSWHCHLCPVGQVGGVSTDQAPRLLGIRSLVE